jgi:hypothetical protein
VAHFWLVVVEVDVLGAAVVATGAVVVSSEYDEVVPVLSSDALEVVASGAVVSVVVSVQDELVAEVVVAPLTEEAVLSVAVDAAVDACSSQVDPVLEAVVSVAWDEVLLVVASPLTDAAVLVAVSPPTEAAVLVVDVVGAVVSSSL